MEKLKYARLCSFMEINNVLYKYQFGFRKKHSRSQAVMKVIDNIYQFCDNRKNSLGIYLDLRALDTVNYSILLKKLDIYGARGTILKWFTSYLSNRSQYIVLNNRESNQDFVRYGVPQSSVLGLGCCYLWPPYEIGGPLYFCPMVTIFLYGRPM